MLLIDQGLLEVSAVIVAEGIVTDRVDIAIDRVAGDQQDYRKDERRGDCQETAAVDHIVLREVAEVLGDLVMRRKKRILV